MTPLDPKAVPKLQADLIVVALGLMALAIVVYRAQDRADDIRRQLQIARSRTVELEDERDRAKQDLDGALERLHEVMEKGPSTAPEPQPKPPAAKARSTRAKST